jgi:hypothetical protein
MVPDALVDARKFQNRNFIQDRKLPEDGIISAFSTAIHRMSGRCFWPITLKLPWIQQPSQRFWSRKLLSRKNTGALLSA